MHVKIPYMLKNSNDPFVYLPFSGVASDLLKSLKIRLFLHLVVVVLVLYIPPTAKVKRRRDLGLKSHPKDFFFI